MRIRVRLFAIQRELAGTREVSLELPERATIEDAWAAVVERFPALAPGRDYVRFARNSVYAPADAMLADGDELALIPPVSGGADEGPEADAADRSRGGTRAGVAGAGGLILELRETPFPATLLDELVSGLATPEDGAVVAFLGVTRSSPGTAAPGQEAEAARHAGRRVEALEYEAHPTMTLDILAQIATEIRDRFGVQRLAIVHRVGEVPLGDASVAIVACATHRGAAFDAARYAIDETKGRAPIWKAERFTDGKVWIGEPARDAPP